MHNSIYVAANILAAITYSRIINNTIRTVIDVELRILLFVVIGTTLANVLIATCDNELSVCVVVLIVPILIETWRLMRLINGYRISGFNSICRLERIRLSKGHRALGLPDSVGRE